MGVDRSDQRRERRTVHRVQRYHADLLVAEPLGLYARQRHARDDNDPSVASIAIGFWRSSDASLLGATDRRKSPPDPGSGGRGPARASVTRRADEVGGDDDADAGLEVGGEEARVLVLHGGELRVEGMWVVDAVAVILNDDSRVR